MSTRLLAPALGLILLGSSAVTLAGDGWKHERHYGGGHPGWHDRGWKHGYRSHWRGPVHHHYYGPPRHRGYHAYPPRHYGPHWGPPRGHGGWGPSPHHYRSGGHYPHGWSSDGITVILRSSFY